VPKLWDQTIEAHRVAVREAILDAAAALVDERGLLAVTMSRLAERAGIGRATLYTYFPDVESVLAAWHERQVGRHLHQLSEVGAGAGDIEQRLRAVLEAYARIAFQRSSHFQGAEVAAVLHRGDATTRAEAHLKDFVRDLVAEGAEAGVLRDDVPAEELAGYCLHALGAAAVATSEAAVQRLVEVTLAGLRTAQ